jgi:hypothetical protein
VAVDGRPSGWRSRVAFSPDGGFAYRPNEVLVHVGVADRAVAVFERWARELSDGDKYVRGEFARDEEPIAGEFVRITGPFRVSEAVDRLHSAGVLAQPNHVVFATGCCPPHPSDPGAESFYTGAAARGLSGQAASVGANPFYANPFYANPFYANPFYANPFYANQSGCCGCRCGCGGAGANPFYANPFYANPFYANADPSPFLVPGLHLTGDRRSSARPADDPNASPGASADGVRIAILDTGWAEDEFAPSGLGGISVSVTPQGLDHPDADGDAFLDPAAGHGTFIAGIIEQLAPGAELEAIRVLSGHGDGDEAEIANVLWDLAQRPDTPTTSGGTEALRPHLVNLSFGGYSPHGMGAMAHAVTALNEAGSVVVASAGNDATCVPMYPAVLPEVVSVAALDDEEEAAVFTNYGPWVKACTAGVDIRSLFFDKFNGAEPADGSGDPDDFQGWATWSGTSFAAPRVVAALAQRVAQGSTPQDVVAELVEAASLTRKPMVGTVVNPV